LKHKIFSHIGVDDSIVEKTGLKYPGLKLWIEKSGVEISCKPAAISWGEPPFLAVHICTSSLPKFREIPVGYVKKCQDTVCSSKSLN
jgi:hypothetical protein